jgi:hypothetical protein
MIFYQFGHKNAQVGFGSGRIRNKLNKLAFRIWISVLYLRSCTGSVRNIYGLGTPGALFASNCDGNKWRGFPCS